MSTSVELELVEQGTERGLRRLSFVIALAAVVLCALAGVPALLAFPDWSPLWTAGCLVLLALFAVLLAGSLRAPLRLLMVCWYAPAPLCIVLGLTAFAAYTGDDTEHLLIWVWSLDPAALAALALVAPAGVALGAAVAASFAPLLSSLLVTGGASATLLESTGVHLAVVTLVMILLAVRMRLVELRHSEAAAAAVIVEQVRREAAIERQRALTRIVHDEVLAVFTAALQLRGAVPDELRREAASALVTLDRVEEAPAGTLLSPEAVIALIGRAVREAEHACAMETSAEPAGVPAAAATAIAAAAAEAVRNSVRHAGKSARRRVIVRVADGEVHVAVSDDGVGFDPAAIDPARIGVRESILGRMHALDGGSAEIDSAPGQGTEVRVGWRR